MITSFISFINEYICSGGRDATAWEIAAGASSGLTLWPYGVSTGGATGPPGPIVPDLFAVACKSYSIKILESCKILWFRGICQLRTLLLFQSHLWINSMISRSMINSEITAMKFSLIQISHCWQGRFLVLIFTKTITWNFYWWKNLENFRSNLLAFQFHDHRRV